MELPKTMFCFQDGMKDFYQIETFTLKEKAMKLKALYDTLFHYFPEIWMALLDHIISAIWIFCI